IACPPVVGDFRGRFLKRGCGIDAEPARQGHDPCRLPGWHRLRGEISCDGAGASATFVRAPPNLLLLRVFVQKRVSILGGSMVGLRRSGGVLAMILAVAAPALAQQPSPAGHVKIASGSAFIVRQNATLPARPGDLVFATDALRTGVDGTVGVP